MCSIIGSFSKNKIEELVELNQHRGNFSYSITVIDKDYNIINQIKDFGLFDKSKLSGEGYFICHVQSPTNGMLEDKNRIHPTENNNTFMWHNGLIKNRGIKDLQKFLKTDIEFDTLLLHKAYKNYSLSDIEGLFTCLYLDKGIEIFRTRHGKLYIDEDMNISSERFPDSKCINYDTIYNVDVQNKKLTVQDTFKTKRFNICIDGEI